MKQDVDRPALLVHRRAVGQHRPNLHAVPSRKVSSRLSQEATWFQLAVFWSTNKSLMSKAESRNPRR